MSGNIGYRLHDPLPSDVLIGGNTVWSRYRRYPVFSWPWLTGRIAVFSACIGFFACLTVVGVGVGTGNYRAGLASGGYLFVAFLLMSSLGPAAATLVRHRRWPEARERMGVVLALLAGVALAYFIDSWASAHMERLIGSAAGNTEAAAQARASAAEAGGIVRTVMLALNIALVLAIYGIAGGGLALRAYFSERRRWDASVHARQLQALRAEKRDADLRLGVLQAQVEPHFLFNTLASVRALVRRDPERAEQTLDALVSHLRATIPKLRDGEAILHATLGQQLDICASYLDVMRLRTGDRLSFRIHAAPELRALPYPPLLLLTLVENAVKHGIEPKPGPGRIELRVVRDGKSLRASVADDGMGLQPGTGAGMGLANVRAQLQARFGERAMLRLSGRDGAGTLAEIVIPMEPLA